MKLRCPACGADFTLEAAAAGQEMEALAKAAALFGADWELVQEYVDGFKARRNAAMQIKKRLRLLREVWEMWRALRFQLDGQEYVVSREAFREALRQVGNRELSGLKNHNYLKQVLKAAAQRYGAQQERELRQRETRLQAGIREGAGGGEDGREQEFQSFLDKLFGAGKGGPGGGKPGSEG